MQQRIFTGVFCLFALSAFPGAFGAFGALWLSAQNTQTAPIQGQAEISEFQPAELEEGRPGMRPGLGIGNFSSDDLQRQLETVRQLSATPLQLPLPKELSRELSRESSKEQEKGQKKEPESVQESTEEGTMASNPVAAEPINQGSPAPVLRPKDSSVEPTVENRPLTQAAPLEQRLEAERQTSDRSENKLKFAPQKLDAQLDAQLDAMAKAPKSLPEKVSPVKNLSKNVASPPSLNEWVIPQRGTAEKQINISKTIPLGDSFQLSLHGLIWTYIPGLSEYPRKPEFERELGNLKTSFHFRFLAVGRYFLTFSRQFPSTGELEYYNAEIIVEGSKPSAYMIAAPIDSNNTTQQNIKLTDDSSGNVSNLDNDINYRITSQVISDIHQMLKDGELEAAYHTLNSWPEYERGSIYDTAARYFLEAGMNLKAADMWQRNVSLEGDLHGKAIKGILEALTRSDNPSRLFEWLPQFLEQAKNQSNNPNQNQLINSEDFAKLFQTISKLNQNSEKGLMGHPYSSAILDFYQTYVNLYPDRNSPEILYHMGLFFEKPGKSQDLRRARQLYNNIQINYPVDKYNSRASDRLNYLNRQVFLVR